MNMEHLRRFAEYWAVGKKTAKTLKIKFAAITP